MTVMICCRCDQSIESGELHQRLLRDSMSGAGITMHRHERCADEPGAVSAPGKAGGPQWYGAEDWSRLPPMSPAHALAWGRFLTHVGACGQCNGDDPWSCEAGRVLRRVWRTAARESW
ncbi:hypothetical protein ACIP88_04065 [Streptomyces uncialis]|uniref:hypothetical protein n=1 Tax=Streptomyces uncialis TaxID=1048205 RepID=UPI0037F35409